MTEYDAYSYDGVDQNRFYNDHLHMRYNSKDKADLKDLAKYYKLSMAQIVRRGVDLFQVAIEDGSIKL